MAVHVGGDTVVGEGAGLPHSHATVGIVAVPRPVAAVAGPRRRSPESL